MIPSNGVPTAPWKLERRLVLCSRKRKGDEGRRLDENTLIQQSRTLRAVWSGVVIASGENYGVMLSDSAG